MDKTMETEYWVPEHVREYLRSLGFVLPLEAMEGYIRMWHEWMQSVGSFYDYRDYVGSYITATRTASGESTRYIAEASIRQCACARNGDPFS